MLKKFMGVALAALLACTPVYAATPTMSVGDTSIAVPVKTGYVSAREKAPEFVQRLQSAMGSGGITIFDIYMSTDDVEQARAGMSIADTFYVYGTMDSLKNAKVNDKDWAFARRVIARTISQIDPNKEFADDAERASKRLAAEAGVDAEVTLGTMDKPKVYGDDPESVRLSMVMPMELNVVGETERRVLDVDAAIARVRERVVVLYVYRMRDGDTAVPATREALASALDEMRVLNR